MFITLVTPFKEDKVDFDSYKRLINRYIEKGVNGFITLATTGEIPTISEYEFQEIIEKTLKYNDNRLSVYVGVGGNCTSKVVNQLKMVEEYQVNGILSICPYYNRPD